MRRDLILILYQVFFGLYLFNLLFPRCIFSHDLYAIRFFLVDIRKLIEPEELLDLSRIKDGIIVIDTLLGYLFLLEDEFIERFHEIFSF